MEGCMDDGSAGVLRCFRYGIAYWQSDGVQCQDTACAITLVANSGPGAPCERSARGFIADFSCLFYIDIDKAPVAAFFDFPAPPLYSLPSLYYSLTPPPSPA